MEEILAKIKYLSNTDYCQSAGDIENALEDIFELIENNYPEIEELEN